MSGIALDRFDVSTTKLQLVCDTCMSETMKNHIRQSLFINNLLHLITQIAVSDRKTKGRSHDQIIILILTAQDIL